MYSSSLFVECLICKKLKANWSLWSNFSGNIKTLGKKPYHIPVLLVLCLNVSVKILWFRYLYPPIVFSKKKKCHCLPFDTLGQNKTKFIWIDKEQMNQFCFPFTAKKKSKLLKQLTRSSNEGGFTNTYLAFRSVCLMFLTPLISTSNTQSLPDFWINSTAILLWTERKKLGWNLAFITISTN